MDREKEIDRMVEIAREYSKDIANTPYYKGVVTDMTALYEAGYRKAEEVRKETAKEILQDVKSTLAILMVHGEYCDDWNCGKVIEFIDKVINPVETKYGVEVDE